MPQRILQNISKQPDGQLIDFHTHLLPGIDDGATNLEESIRMARMLVDAGYGTAYCTPHFIKGIYDADNATVRDAIQQLQQALDNEAIPLRLLGGREYYLNENLLELLDDPMPLDGTNYLLIEIPGYIYPEVVIAMFTELIRKSFIPMLAHPERCNLFNESLKNESNPLKRLLNRDDKRLVWLQPDPYNRDLLRRLLAMGCAFQADLGSFIGNYGPKAKANAHNFTDAEIYTHTGTDIHNEPQLKKLLKSLK